MVARQQRAPRLDALRTGKGRPMPVPSSLRRIVPLVLALVLAASAGWSAPGITRAQELPARFDRVVAVATTDCHSLVLRDDGTVWGWGCNSDWQLGATAPRGAMVAPTPIQAEGLDQVRSIASGDAHSLAVRADGTVW